MSMMSKVPIDIRPFKRFVQTNCTSAPKVRDFVMRCADAIAAEDLPMFARMLLDTFNSGGS